MEELADKILNSDHVFKPDDRHYYSLCKSFDLDDLVEGKTLGKITPIINLEQPSFPGSCKPIDYQKNGRKLANDYNENLHIPLGEILRAIDCRMAELLFYLGMYPEKDWVIFENQLGFLKKGKLLAKVLPQEMYPKRLLNNVAKIRNISEHQYSKPTREHLDVALEVMDSFLSLTEDLATDILYYKSAYQYTDQDTGKPIIVQIMRDRGFLLIFYDNENPPTSFGIDAKSPIGRKIIKKICYDIEFHFKNTPSFWTDLGF